MYLIYKVFSYKSPAPKHICILKSAESSTKKLKMPKACEEGQQLAHINVIAERVTS